MQNQIRNELLVEGFVQEYNYMYIIYTEMFKNKTIFSLIFVVVTEIVNLSYHTCDYPKAFNYSCIFVLIY